MEQNLDNYTLEEIAKMEIPCRCGMTHSTGIEHIIVEEGAINKLVGVVERQKKKDGSLIDKEKDVILVTEDVHTRIVAGDRVKALLKEAGYQVECCYFPEEDLIATDEASDRVKAMIRPETVLLIAVGSGTLNDVTKYAGFQTGVPFYIVGTAPSMDGYASPVAPMIIKGLKYALDAMGPTAIIGDVDVLKDAPLRLMAAGFGDLVGKCVSICDWKISNIVNGEHYCQLVADTVLQSVDLCISNIDGLLKRDKTAVKNMMDALILCGLMMNYVKSSRPASGSEHGIDHFWELMHLFAGRPIALHGEGVGVGSIASCVILEKFLEEKPDFAAARKRAENWDRKAWEAEIRRICPIGAEDVFKLEDDFKKNQLVTVGPRLEAIEANWPEILKTIRTYVPTPEKMVELLQRAKGVTTPQEMNLTRQNVQDAICYAKDTRYRYSILQLIWDLGVVEKYRDYVDAYFYKGE